MKVYRFTDEMMGSNIYLLQPDLLEADRDFAKQNRLGEVVVDTGTGYNTWEILKQIGDKVPLKEIKSIVLTHMHFDHIGGSETFAKATGARIFISEKDGEFVRKKDKRSTAFESSFSDMPDIDMSPLKEGDEIGPLRVIETPGHTSGSICLYEPEEKLLFTGDTVFADGFGRYDLPTGNREALKSSIKKLASLDVRVIYPGHGDTIGGELEDVRKFLLELSGII
jgi:glyoxylase-like metal-dependent hydrolase (beta-lactamase superfamily II)